MKKNEIKGLIWITFLICLGWANENLGSQPKLFLPELKKSAKVSALSFEKATIENGKKTKKTIKRPLKSPKKTRTYTKSEFIDLLNKGKLKELTKLKGIGLKTAQKIIDYRREKSFFEKPDDLIKVKGIGKVKLKSLLIHVTFE